MIDKKSMSRFLRILQFLYHLDQFLNFVLLLFLSVICAILTKMHDQSDLVNGHIMRFIGTFFYPFLDNSNFGGSCHKKTHTKLRFPQYYIYGI